MTGARGLLGAHLMPLLADRFELFALDRPGGEPMPGAIPVAADLSRPIDVGALPPRIDAVVHLAQSGRYRDFPGGAGEVFQVNLASLAALLDYARGAGARHFVHASSGAVYRRSSEPLAEDSPTAAAEALGFYAATKLAGELLAQSYASEMIVASLRYFFIYGRGQKSGMLVPRLIESVRSGAPVTLQGADGIRINPVHALDAAAATAAALELDESATVNVAGPEIHSIRAMAETIGEGLGIAPRFESSEGEPGDLIGDTARMRTLLAAPERRFGDQVGELLR